MMTVADLMTTDVIALKASDTLRTAKNVMLSARIRHIPVTAADGSFVGLVTHRDVLAAAVSKFAELDPAVQDELDSGSPLSEIMRVDVTAVEPDLPLKTAAEVLLKHKYGCLPVLEDGRLVGILTEADFVKLAARLLAVADED